MLQRSMSLGTRAFLPNIFSFGDFTRGAESELQEDHQGLSKVVWGQSMALACLKAFV